MATYPSGFSERVFEFAFNAEFATTYKTVIAGLPYIPTQNLEKALGYDVRFEIKKRGQPRRFIALQHKVARYIDGCSGSNFHVREKVGCPYYCTKIDPDQFNTIRKQCGTTGLDFYYCAPKFHEVGEMNKHYTIGQVRQNSAWFDISACNLLTNTEGHKLVYDRSATKAYVFSGEGQKVEVIPPEIQIQRLHQAPPVNAGRIFDELFEHVRDSDKLRAKVERDTRKDAANLTLNQILSLRKRNSTLALAALVAEAFDASLLVVAA